MFDLIIIGSGPAGLAASIYASRYHLNHLVIGSELGGTINYAHKVDNYPGLPGLTGPQLAQKLVDHAKQLGATIETKAVTDLQKTDQNFIITTSDGKKTETKTLILATGTKRRELGVPGEIELKGKGVSYCPTCDAAFYQDKTVVIVGGADAACSGAVHLAKFAKKVFLLYRKNQLRADPTWLKEVQNNDKIAVLYETNIIKILGYKDIKILSEEEKSLNIPVSQYPNINSSNDRVAAVELDKEYQGSKYLVTDGVFVEIGGVPMVELAKKIGINIDDEGYLPTNEDMSTNVSGAYCVGDVGTHWKQLQQVVTAVAEGAVASYSAYQYLHKS